MLTVLKPLSKSVCTLTVLKPTSTVHIGQSEAFKTISHVDLKAHRRLSLFNFWSSLFGSFCRILFVYGAHCFVRGRGAITLFILQFLKFARSIRLRSSLSTPFYLMVLGFGKFSKLNCDLGF